MIMQDYEINRATVSLLTSTVSLIMGVCTIPVGIVATKIGMRKTFAIGFCFMASGALTPFCSNIIQLLATRIVFAIGVAAVFPIAGGLVMQWFSGKERPLVNGLNMSAMSMGNTITLFTVVMIANNFVSLAWKAPLTVYGVATLVFALAWLILGKEHKEPAVKLKAEDASLPMNIGTLLRQRNTLLLCLTIMGPFILHIAITSWLPTYYHEVFDMPLSQASSITGLFPMFGIIGCILGGLLPMWAGLRKPFLIIPGILLGFAGLGTFLVDNLTIIYISITLLGICNLMFLPILFTICMELPVTTPRVAALTIAAMLAVGNISGFIGPLIVGFLTDITNSYLPGLVVCSVLSWSVPIGGFLLPETGPRVKQPKKLGS
jgi:cyanate permease